MPIFLCMPARFYDYHFIITYFYMRSKFREEKKNEKKNFNGL
jgi:hypothetical protein